MKVALWSGLIMNSLIHWGLNKIDNIFAEKYIFLNENHDIFYSNMSLNVVPIVNKWISIGSGYGLMMNRHH